MASVHVARSPISIVTFRHGAFFAALIRVDDGSRALALEPELCRDLLGDYKTYRPGVDDSFDRRPSDVRLDPVSAVYVLAVAAVLQRHVGSNLSCRHGFPILFRY
ncbi:MAG: hypothetical protein OXG04_26140 [Acidobacteria bacterium]|nr:hypothetical protein [Acidobacteriota bacterium]